MFRGYLLIIDMKTITYRNLGLIDSQQFVLDMNDRYGRKTEGIFSDVISRYNKVMKELLDKHAPLITKTNHG